MTDIYGKYIACDESVVSCGCDYTYCEHSKAVFKKYGYSYATSSKLRQIIKVLLDYQEASLDRLCSLELPLLPLVESIGFKACYYESTPGDCVTICGDSYRPHLFSKIKTENCKSNCVTPEYTDEFLVNVLNTLDYLNYPSRENIQVICDIFGWGLIYTTDYISILIGTDDPNLYKPVIDLIPVPIGEQIRLLTDC